MHIVLEIHIVSRKWVRNLGDEMIRYTGTEQLSFEGFETHLGKELDGTNRWVRMAAEIPWDALAGIYERSLREDFGRPSDCRSDCEYLPAVWASDSTWEGWQGCGVWGEAYGEFGQYVFLLNLQGVYLGKLSGI